MAQKALVVKAERKPKFSTREIIRCMECGRVRSVFRDYRLCRIHFRDHVYKGLLPGFKKASW